MRILMLTFLTVLLMSFGVSQAADSVAVALYNVTDGVYETNGSTIYAQDGDGNPIMYRVEMSLENDVILGGMSLGLVFKGDAAINVNWEPQTGGWGAGGQDDWAITVEGASRFKPESGTTGSFDMTGLYVTEQDVDSIAPDSIILGGVALWNGLIVGPMEHMFNFNFSLDVPGNAVDFTIDSSKIGASGDWTFVDLGGGGIAAAFSGAINVMVEQSASQAAGDNPAIAYTYGLEQNYPNPFNPVTGIDYSLARKSQVDIAVFNILGQRVNTLVSGEIEAGNHFIEWHGDDDSGHEVASGIYFYKMVTDEYVETRKMVLMR
ncbi:MAG: FlgD immunoglobulin-like domain containing protein [Candidatus Zixiibacteriota bacterium]